MKAEIRWFWARLNANYWFYPALFAIVAGVLAFVMIWLDRNGFAEFLNETQAIIPARPRGASDMLTVMAGSMIGVAATVFSITIAAVAYASGNYGPRLLTNFMEDRGNQLSLATFIGSFVYALIVLRAVRAEDESASHAAEAAVTALPGFVPQLSLLVAYVLMAFCVAVLVYFLNHIPSSIRINTVLEGIGRRLLSAIDKAYPDEASEGEAPESPGGTPFATGKTGYIQLIEFDELAKLARKHECTIALARRTGDFVHPGVTLAWIGKPEIDDELAERLESAFTFGASRTPEQDPQFLIDELVEIGLRALSPGTNDPFTAITAIHWLGAATARIGTRDLAKRVCEDGADSPVTPVPDDFAHYLQRGFGSMRSAVATSPTAALVMLDSLRDAALPIASKARRALLREQGKLLLEQANLALAGPDLAEVEQRHAAFDKAFWD
jgi:uncharacterized membrane protein